MALDANDLAKTMEECLEKEWQAVKGEALPTIGRQDLRLLLTAVAQGVVKHLQDKAEVVLSDPKHDHEHDITCSVNVNNLTTSGTPLGHDHRATCTVTIKDHKHTYTGNVK